MHDRQIASALLLISGLLMVGPVVGQDKLVPDQPAEEPSDPITELNARVVEVSGDVAVAPNGTSPLDVEGWTQVKLDDQLSAGTMIRTGIRSHLILLFGDDTVINVKRVTLASIDSFYKTANQETIRLGLGYGALRGGSAEGELRSDLIIDSTVATLAKRGTEGFELYVEPYTGRFTVSLSRSGLVEALQKLTGQRRLVRPGQFANDLNIAKLWIKQDQFDRHVNFFATESLTAADLDFTLASRRGTGVINPGAGSQLDAFVRPQRRDLLVDRFFRPSPGQFLNLEGLIPDLMILERLPVVRPEGNFGVSDTFRVLLPEQQKKQRRRSFRAGRFSRRG